MKESEFGLRERKIMILGIFVFSILFCFLPFYGFADVGKAEVAGKVYEFDKKNNYEFNKSDIFSISDEGNTYGSFFVRGDISNVTEVKGIPSYEVTEGNLEFFYNYGDFKFNSDEESWLLTNDKSKKVADVKLDSSIMKGTMILQTSKDRINWINDSVIYNAFSDTPIRTESFFSSNDVQLMNGCYYRVIIVYELRNMVKESNLPLVNMDKYEYKRYAEVYELYAHTDKNKIETVDNNQTYSLGSKVRVKNFDGYFGEETINKNDIHYGWNLGDFFVSGYTDKAVDSKGDIVFLKNVGDKVALWFRLNENINAIDGKNNLSITADTEGYDQYFETPKMNFGRGVLIIRYTDHNNIKAEPIIYTNYLEANASVGADTKVQLFEEGDYEITLNYEVTKDELIDKIGHYRIFFKFSVRNGNCMVYPFDIVTNSELTNSSMTENGFRLDLAKSRYLKINIKREVMKEGADGLIEDTRSNGPARDGAKYTDEGIYSITVSNEYTNQSTVKKIYVGKDSLLRAHMTSGLAISEINDLISQGAKISESGAIQLDDIKINIPLPGQTEKANQSNSWVKIFFIAAIIIGAGLIFFFLAKDRKKKEKQMKGDEEE